MRRYVVLAVIGALLIAAGTAWWSIPAGVIVLGVEALLGAYGGAYMKVKGVEDARR